MVVFPLPSLCPKLCFSDIFLCFQVGSLWSPVPNYQGDTGLWDELLSCLKRAPGLDLTMPPAIWMKLQFLQLKPILSVLKRWAVFSEQPSFCFHSWRLWNRMISLWSWGCPAVDHWLVKTLFLHSCELSITKWCYLALCHLGLNGKRIWLCTPKCARS